MNKGKEHVETSPVLPPKLDQVAGCSNVPPLPTTSISGTVDSFSEISPPLSSVTFVPAPQDNQANNSHFSPEKAFQHTTLPSQNDSPMDSSSPLIPTETAIYNPFDVLAPPSAPTKVSNPSSLSVPRQSSSPIPHTQTVCFIDPLANSSLSSDMVIDSAVSTSPKVLFLETLPAQGDDPNRS